MFGLLISMLNFKKWSYPKIPFFIYHIPMKLVSSAPPVCTCNGSKKEIVLKKRTDNKLRQMMNNNLKAIFSCLSNKCM